MVENSKKTKCLVIGHGPSYTDYDFIREFDGIKLCVDISMRDMIQNDIVPDYMLFSETMETITKHVSEWLPVYLTDYKSRFKVIYRSKAIAPLPTRIGRLKLQSEVYDSEIYGNYNAINNVGLYSICYATDVLKIPEIHLIGLDYKGDDYPQSMYDGWIASTIHYYNNRNLTPEIIDHSGGDFPPFDRKYLTR